MAALQLRLRITWTRSASSLETEVRMTSLEPANPNPGSLGDGAFLLPTLPRRAGHGFFLFGASQSALIGPSLCG